MYKLTVMIIVLMYAPEFSMYGIVYIVFFMNLKSVVVCVCYLLQVDPYHTLFGLAGLSLLGHSGIRSVDPVFCMPSDVIQRLGIKYQLL